MSGLQEIPVHEFTAKIHNLFDKQWFLLTSGDFAAKSFNTMTISWGSLGVMWNKPFAQVVVRPTRYTYQFIDQYNSFTLCAFPEKYRAALQLLGSRSGRHGDKIAEAGLTPVAASHVASPAFAEAELIIECQKMYWDDFDITHFLDPKILNNYPRKDFHRIYFGEIMGIRGAPVFNPK